MSQVIRIGLAGLGNVGAGVFRHLSENAAFLEKRCGCLMEVTRVAVRDRTRPRSGVPNNILTDKWPDLIDDPDIDIIVELIGGTTEARELVERAIKAGKTVVTGNKALLAEQGHEIFALATEHQVPLFFEAAVAGGIPIIKAVRESLVANRIKAIYGIINGTSNYILTRMRDGGLGYKEALSEAQRLGYAEADPTLDVNGWDAGHKAVLLAVLVSGRWVEADQIHVKGVENIESTDIAFADQLGYELKLLAVIRRHDETDRIEVRVQPSLVPRDHLLASVNGVFNALVVCGDVVGETLFYGSGAGQDPTSSAVLSDIVEAARALRDRRVISFVESSEPMPVMPVEETLTHYYVRLQVDNAHGVLAEIASILARHGAGITTVLQPEATSSTAELVMVIEGADYGSVRTALRSIAKLDSCLREPVLLRMELLGKTTQSDHEEPT